MKITIDCSDLTFDSIRGLVILRDRRCAVCGSTAILHVHHTNGKDNNDPDYLVTLCSICHRKEHGDGRKQIHL